VSKAIRGRDGFTRDFGCGRYENLSGAFSWLTFFAGGAADVRRSRSDWTRELAEPTICSQRKPRSFRCSARKEGLPMLTDANRPSTAAIRMRRKKARRTASKLKKGD
jgi:hypothetical protein